LLDLNHWFDSNHLNQSTLTAMCSVIYDRLFIIMMLPAVVIFDR